MFQSAALKLTAYYLAIIMTISVIFSLILFQISTAELDHGLRRPGFQQQIIISGPNGDFEQFRQERLQESSSLLRDRLIIINVLTLVAGGGLSYVLARRTLRPIEDAMEAQVRFTADASHELRTPLTVMQTEIEVALRAKTLDMKTAKKLLESNLEEVAKLRNLSESLLRLAREDGALAATDAMSLDELGDDVISRVIKIAQEKTITIKNELQAIQVLVDREALTETLVILLDNAVKYSPAQTTIKLKSQLKNEQIMIQVIDQGQGIKASDVPHIFERFYRADQSRTSQSVSGYGLGLSIAQKLAGLQGGEISVVSKPAHGSTFTLVIPHKTA